MAADLLPPVSPDLPVSSSDAPGTHEIDVRWAAWRAKVAADDRMFRRRIVVVGPALLIAAVVMTYLLGL